MIQTTKNALLLTFMAVLVGVWVQAQTERAIDLVITNGHIMDGTDSPWYSGDLGIRAGKIAAIGNLFQTPRTFGNSVQRLFSVRPGLPAPVHP